MAPRPRPIVALALGAAAAVPLVWFGVHARSPTGMWLMDEFNLLAAQTVSPMAVGWEVK